MAAINFGSGHSTTVTNGNMYSCLRDRDFRRDSVNDGRQQVVGSADFRDARVPRGASAVTSVTPGVPRSASIGPVIASATPGHGERREFRFRIIRRQRFDRRQALAMRVGDVAGMPDAQIPER